LSHTRKSISKRSMVRSTNLLDGRAGFRLSAEWGHISVLEGGGHICELNLKACDGVNPLWRPPWKTIDPDKYEASKHRRTYGLPPEGKLLAGIAGHNLCFDHFGPPSPEETAAGRTTHGEAPVLKWHLLRIAQTPVPALAYGVTLPEAQTRFSREISLDRHHPVVYCEETAVNLSMFDRPISWTQHVTFGPPFLECDRTLFDMSATRGKACSSDFSPRLAVKPDAEFVWPLVPSEDGGQVNLRMAPRGRFGRFTAQLLDPNLGIAFVAASNPRLQLLVVYAFRRADFPWVGNWEEQLCRTHVPWRGRAFTRGMEFSTTPLPLPRRETVKQGSLFGESTYRWLLAKSQARIRFLILLFKIPEDFRGTARVDLTERKARVVETEEGREFTVPVKEFL